MSRGKSDSRGGGGGGIGGRDLGIRLRQQQQQQQQHSRPLYFCDYGTGGTTRMTAFIVAEPPRTASSASVKAGRSYRMFLQDEGDYDDDNDDHGLRQDAAAFEEWIGTRGWAGRRWRHTVGLGRRDAPRVGDNPPADDGFQLVAVPSRRHTIGDIGTSLPRVTTDITVVHSGKPD